MAYQFMADETVPAGLTRIVSEEIASATENLRPIDGNNQDEAIHEVRKSVKKIRGALRLVQPELGELYTLLNAELGEAGKTLSELRDAAAIIETFDSVVAQYRDQLRDDAMASIRQGLEKRKSELEESAGVSKVMTGMADALGKVAGHLDPWPVATDGFEAISQGLEDTYRSGRKAMSNAYDDQTAEDFHTWRKRVKDHWYHIRLLQNLSTDNLPAREAHLKELETALGEDHNLAVLHDALHQNPESFGPPNQINLFLMMASQYQDDLLEKALRLGSDLYQQKPRQFTNELSALWNAWRGEPKISKKQQKKQEGESKKKTTAA